MVLYTCDGAKPWRGGSVPGCRKSKPRQRLGGYYIIYADYCVDDPLHARWYLDAVSG
jgi:hypothetical protein